MSRTIVNAQGIPPMVPLLDKPDAHHLHSFQSGYFGTKWAMQRAFPTMRDQGGGSIVNTTSNWASTAPPNASDYNGNKAALEALTRSAAHEWGRYNINVNIVAPASKSAGWDNWEAVYPELARQVIRDNPMGRVKIFFSEPDYYIHGTEAEESLGTAASHGCLRMSNDNVIELARAIMEHGGETRPAGWFQRIINRFRDTEEVRLSQPLPMTVRR